MLVVDSYKAYHIFDGVWRFDTSRNLYSNIEATIVRAIIQLYGDNIDDYWNDFPTDTQYMMML